MTKKLSPDMPVSVPGNLTVGDFWSWAYSDILSNTNRGVFAEFLVGAALNAIDNPRIEWDGYDLVYQGQGVEVKSSAFLQSWEQNGLSRVSFDIQKKSSWNAAENTYDDVIRRSAACYVFCLYAETDPAQANPLNISSWEFYVLSTSRIDEMLGDQKSISLNPLRRLVAPVSYSDLRRTVDDVLAGSE
jgi:hypothetical protein